MRVAKEHRVLLLRRSVLATTEGSDRAGHAAPPAGGHGGGARPASARLHRRHHRLARGCGRGRGDGRRVTAAGAAHGVDRLLGQGDGSLAGHHPRAAGDAHRHALRRLHPRWSTWASTRSSSSTATATTAASSTSPPAQGRRRSRRLHGRHVAGAPQRRRLPRGAPLGPGGRHPRRGVGDVADALLRRAGRHGRRPPMRTSCATTPSSTPGTASRATTWSSGPPGACNPARRAPTATQPWPRRRRARAIMAAVVERYSRFLREFYAKSGAVSRRWARERRAWSWVGATSRHGPGHERVQGGRLRPARSHCSAKAAPPCSHSATLDPGGSSRTREEWCRAAVDGGSAGAWAQRHLARLRCAGIGVSSQGISFVPVDRTGQPLANAVSWLDMHATDRRPRSLRSLPEPELFARTGKRASPAYVLPKLLVAATRAAGAVPAEPPASSWLTTTCSHHLGGEYGHRPLPRLGHDALRRHGAELGHACSWRSSASGRSSLPALAWSGAVPGDSRRRRPRATGLPTGTPVAVGGQDQKLAALAVGAGDGRGGALAGHGHRRLLPWPGAACSTRPCACPCSASACPAVGPGGGGWHGWRRPALAAPHVRARTDIR